MACFVIIYVASIVQLSAIILIDKEHGLYWDSRKIMWTILFTILAVIKLEALRDSQKKYLYCIYIAYMVTAVYCDVCTQYVYRFLYIPAVIAGIRVFMLNQPGMNTIMLFCLFSLLNLLLFRRFMGRADTVTFIISVLFFGEIGGNLLLSGLSHMLLSMLFLFLIKWRKIDFMTGSIQPTAFMPYIAAASLCIFIVTC